MTITRVEILGHPGEPVSAVCALNGCQRSSLETDLRRLEAEMRQFSGYNYVDVRGYQFAQWADTLAALLRPTEER